LEWKANTRKALSRLQILGVAIAIALGGWYFMVRGSTPKPTLSGTSLVIFGDSLAEGMESSAGHDIASVLREKNPFPVINAGAAGDTTASALARFDASVLSQDPKIVVIIIGANDMLRGLPVDEAKRNIETMIDRTRAKGAGVVLVGFRGNGFVGDPYGRMYDQVAKEKSVPIVSDVLRGIFGNPEYMSSDNLHPNDLGYKLIAERIQGAVEYLVR
jgi:acyl-CoA thioesterase-1